MINIISIFAKSPFKPIRDHMDKVVESVIPLNDFFEALFQEDFSKVEKIQQQVIKAEKEADLIKNEIRNHLPRNIFMPINRRDLLEMLDMQDSIADVAQDIVVLLNIRRMSLTKELGQDVIESGFGRLEIKKLLEMIENVSIAETEADNLEEALFQRLYEVEEKMNSVDVIFWYKIFELIGDIADFSKKTGNRLRLMIATK